MTEERLFENELVVAVMPNGTQEELALSHTVSKFELQAESIIIENDDEYNAAGQFGRNIKRAASEVITFFKPMKEAANKAHREVCEREKQMLVPLQRAEKVLKSSMGAYALRLENERKAAEAEAKRIAQEEADRKLAEAIKAESEGDAETARSAMFDAQMADTMSRSISVLAEIPKAEGISQSKDWVIESITSYEVPVSFNGMELRPVDEKAVMRLIRASKGQMAIPGVKYSEIVKTSIRK